jgi:hypothetical protein
MEKMGRGGEPILPQSLPRAETPRPALFESRTPLAVLGSGRLHGASARARSLTPRMIVIVLLAWVALAGAFAAWRFGPLAAEPGSARDRSALALAFGVIATLIVMLVRVSREARRAATRNGADSTGNE